MKNKKLYIITAIIIVAILLFVIGLKIYRGKSEGTNDIKKSESMLKADRIMSDGSYQIRFSDLVSLSDLKEYNNKTVTAIGYLSPITSFDGSFGYLMNLPYQTCPYCMPSDTKITNTIAVFAKSGDKIKFTEAAIMVRGTLKLEEYTDSYGYSYKYRIIDATIEEADTSKLGKQIVLYNQLAEKEIMTNLIETLNAVDQNVFYDEYIANGAKIERAIIDLTKLEKVIEDLKEFNEEDVAILVNISNSLKEIAQNTNKCIEEKNYTKISEYKEKTSQLFYELNKWMSMHTL